jgi:CBS domain-containing protein
VNTNIPVSAILAHKGSTVWSVKPEETVFEAIRMMVEKNIGALPVMQAERLIGMISERDYTRKVVIKGKSSKETPVKDIMSEELVVVTPHETVEECMRLMTERRVRHLPVVEDNKLLGIVSIGDLVKWTISAQAATIDQLQKYIDGSYPA